MISFVVGFVIGALVGWHVPQPTWVAPLIQKIKDWFKSKV